MIQTLVKKFSKRFQVLGLELVRAWKGFSFMSDRVLGRTRVLKQRQRQALVDQTWDTVLALEYGL